MDLPEIGAHCFLRSCNVNDFLPIRCRCDQLFCKDHISPEAHSCPVLQTTNTSSDTQSKMQRCAANNCSKPSLEAFVADQSDAKGRTAAVCERCKQAFCATHRTPASHSCTAPDPTLPPPRNEAAKALLAKIFPPTAQTTASSASGSASVPAKRKAVIPSNPKKAAQLRQVELMKMRHRAQPADPKDKGKHVPIDQKLHVKVSLSENRDDEKLFWFQKTMSTGKGLDILAAHFGASSDSAPLFLCKTSGSDPEESAVLQNDKLLVEQVEDGSTLIIRH